MDKHEKRLRKATKNEELGEEEKLKKLLPQKRHYRQRAHSNPICDHIMDYPVCPDDMNWNEYYPEFDQSPDSKVEFLDIGCGYGGLLVELAPLFPKTLMLGMEIRVKVSQYVQERVVALRKMHPGSYSNIACVRSNAMKYLPNFFRKGTITKMFFLYPDPHFKRAKHKWRIISDTLLSEYAFLLSVGGLVYICTDVKDLYDWMVKHFTEHPLFVRVEDAEMETDMVASKIRDSTEEGKKVTRNNGDKFVAMFRRIEYSPRLQLPERKTDMV